MDKFEDREKMLKDLAYDTLVTLEEKELEMAKALPNNRITHLIPLQEEYKHKFERKFDLVNKIFAPYFTDTTKEELFQEIQDKMYVRLKPIIFEFNECNRRAYDLHDHYKCCETAMTKLDNDAIPYAKKLAREY